MIFTGPFGPIALFLMTETTIVPVETQVQSMLESPMTDSEIKQLFAVETRSQSASSRLISAKIDRAQCLMEVYQDKLFRGKSGGRTWGQYLKSIDLAKIGYESELDTDSASREIMFGLLCRSIDRWNADNPLRPPLPYPGGRSYLQGWTTLFDRTRSAGNGKGTYASFGNCETALEAWKAAVFKNDGKKPSCKASAEIGRQTRDAGLGRKSLSSQGNQQNMRLMQHESQSSSQPRNASTQTRMEAAAAQREREKRQSEQKAEEKSLREDGIDPRLISKMDDGPDIDAMAECETYCTQLNQLQQDVQRIESWVTGRLNLYGSEGMDALRQVDAGIYTINDDVKAISSLGQKLLDLSDLLSDVIQPGDLSSSLFEAEPTA